MGEGGWRTSGVQIVRGKLRNSDELRSPSGDDAQLADQFVLKSYIHTYIHTYIHAYIHTN